MTEEINHRGVHVEISDILVEELAELGFDAVAEIKAGIESSLPLAEVYTKPNCPFCIKAKALLEKHNIPYQEISAVDDREILFERVLAATGLQPKTVPQIFIDGRHIGGHDQLVIHLCA